MLELNCGVYNILLIIENLISYLILPDLTASIQPDVLSHLMSNRASELCKYKLGLVYN